MSVIRANNASKVLLFFFLHRFRWRTQADLGSQLQLLAIAHHLNRDLVGRFDPRYLVYRLAAIAGRFAVDAQNHATQLQAKGFEVLPSAANFIFARHPQHDAAGVAAKLSEQGVIVRHFKQERIAQFLRISIVTPEQNQSLIDGLGDL